MTFYLSSASKIHQLLQVPQIWLGFLALISGFCIIHMGFLSLKTEYAYGYFYTGSPPQHKPQASGWRNIRKSVSLNIQPRWSKILYFSFVSWQGPPPSAPFQIHSFVISSALIPSSSCIALKLATRCRSAVLRLFPAALPSYFMKEISDWFATLSLLWLKQYFIK